MVVDLVLLAAASSALAGVASDTRSTAFHQCVAVSGGVQAAFGRCAAEEATRADRALNSAYARRRAALSGERRARLRLAQRAWLRQREARCMTRYKEELPGQNAAPLFDLCMADEARSRARELQPNKS